MAYAKTTFVLGGSPPINATNLNIITDAIDSLLAKEPIYSYMFEGKRYDVGDKFGFLQATFDFALKRDDLREPLLAYLKNKLKD